MPARRKPGFDADRLPPSLGISAANDADGDDEAPKPRRRRIRAAAPRRLTSGQRT